jgi:hypothetical protein
LGLAKNVLSARLKKLVVCGINRCRLRTAAPTRNMP